MRPWAYALALAAGAACILLAVTYRMYDFDLWQHLVVGREIWRTHTVPGTQLWSWPTYGEPNVPPSWLFRVLLWPFWLAGEVWGIFAWRWLTTLATFALALLAARRMGATGVAPILALVWCALIYRQRSQARPETLVAMIVAAQILLLEIRRRIPAAAATGRRARWIGWSMVPLACLWVNVHISYYLFFVVGGAYLLDDLLRPARRAAGAPGPLALALLVAVGACFVNPFGWRLLAQPFEYYFFLRHEEIFKIIGELGPIDWPENLRNGLPALFVLILVAGFRHARRHGPDWAQLAILAVALPQAFTSQRFLGLMSVLVAPFLARDLASLARAESWPAALQAPWRRAALVAVAAVGLSVPELMRPYTGPGIGLWWDHFPVRACDWIEQHGVRGRAFNVFYHGGYLLWRFHPDTSRLPFIEAHQAGTTMLRYLYVFALQDPNAWRETHRRYGFDWVVLPRELPANPDLVDFLDADSSWALVFADDGGALYLRRGGAAGALAAAHAYPHLRAGAIATARLVATARSDSAANRGLRADLARAIASSPWNARAHSLAGAVDAGDGRWADAAVHLEEAVRQRLVEAGLRERLGLARLELGDGAGALRAFDEERRFDPAWPRHDLRRAQAMQSLGRRREAVELYRRALAKPATAAEARDSLAALGAE